MNFKKITSLSMFLVMLIMTYSGVMLFVSPPGRVAHWSNWEILGLTKEQYANIHSTFMTLFIFMTIFHIFYNWKPITSYMKNKAKDFILFTKEMIVSSVLVIIFLFGTLFNLFPFSNFLDFGNGIKNSWEQEYGRAPYPHAELSSLQMFSKRLNFNLEKCEEILKQNNFKYEISQSLGQIAKKNGVTAQYIYNLLNKNLQKKGFNSSNLTGLGRKTVKDVAKNLNISTDDFLLKLKTIGIDAKGDEKFKNVTQRYNQTPMDVMIKLGYKK